MFAFILQLPSVAKCQVMFTLYRVAFALAKNWPYRIGLLFTRENGDFGTISVARRSYEAPICKVESHISDRCSYYTGYSVNIASDWNLGTHRRHSNMRHGDSAVLAVKGWGKSRKILQVFFRRNSPVCPILVDMIRVEKYFSLFVRADKLSQLDSRPQSTVYYPHFLVFAQ